MSDNNKNQQDFDHFFKDGFEDFNVPNMRIEQRDNENEEMDQLDQLFRSEFSDFEQTPADHIWQNVKQELPYNLIWKQRLNQLSRIAAVLLIGLLVSVLVGQNPGSGEDLVDQNIFPGQPLEEEINSDFVYDVLGDEADQKENAQTLFNDEAAMAARKKAARANTFDANPITPLPSLPIQELNLVNNDKSQEEQWKEEAEQKGEIPLRLVTAEKDQETKDAQKAEIMARGNNTINPAQ